MQLTDNSNFPNKDKQKVRIHIIVFIFIYKKKAINKTGPKLCLLAETPRKHKILPNPKVSWCFFILK